MGGAVDSVQSWNICEFLALLIGGGIPCTPISPDYTYIIVLVGIIIPVRLAENRVLVRLQLPACPGER